MRCILFLFLVLISAPLSAQQLVPYKDAANHFTIDIPGGWKHTVNKKYPSVKLMAYCKAEGKDTIRDSFNIEVVETADKNLEELFEDLIHSISRARDFKLIDKGRRTVHGVNFIWLIESHTNFSNGIPMHNYDLATVKDGKAYILTMVTFSYAFNNIRPVFEKIAGSFTLLK